MATTDAQDSHSRSLLFSYDKIISFNRLLERYASFPSGTTFSIKRRLSIQNDPRTNIRINSDS